MNKLFSLLLLIAMISCEQGPHGYNYETGSLPDKPVNLTEFNSEYDDYNSTAPSLGSLVAFCFSTNRKSQGNQFDIIYMPMNVNFDKTTGVLTVKPEYANWGIYQSLGLINQGLDEINTSGNEFGPNLIYDQYRFLDDKKFLLLCASDVEGNFQINFTHKTDSSDFSESQPVRFLNSEFDDMYPAFNSDYSKMYFCSNREDSLFNIFYVDIDVSDKELHEVLADTNLRIVHKDETLASNYDDKCPYIFNDIMVFTSNRPSGYGGYDLYYSKLENDEWSVPENLGSKINSEYDEYRPILFEEGVDFERHMLVFSSNRPGGLGGFDLYFVGLKHD
jgi:hypothetical protein